MKLLIGYTTFPNKELATEMAELLLADQLIACANILPSGISMYRWEGTVRTDSEAVMTFKTKTVHQKAIIDLIQKHHSYECPCIVFVPIESGSPDYLKWLEGEC